MRHTITGLLEGYSLKDLRTIAESALREPKKRGQRLSKSAFVVQLGARLANGQHVQQQYTLLSAQERLVLERLLQHGGQARAQDLREEVEDRLAATPVVSSDSPSDTLRNEAMGTFDGLVARLTLRGMVFSTPAMRSLSERIAHPSPGSWLVVPVELRSLFPQPELPTLAWGSGRPPASPAETSAGFAQRDLFIYWSCVRARPILLTQGGLVPKRRLRALNSMLLSPDPLLDQASAESESPQLHFTRLLLQELGLLREQSGSLQVTAQVGKVPEFWKRPVPARSVSGLEAWLSMPRWHELTRVHLSSLHLGLEDARAELVAQLAVLPTGAWLSAERFLNRLSVAAPRILLGGSNAGRSGSSAAAASGSSKQLDRLRQIQAAFVGAALSGPLHWLGLVDVATDGDRLLAFRVNLSGARILSADPRFEEGPQDEGTLVIQPNFRLLAIGPVPEATLAIIEAFADRVSVDRHAVEYQLSRETVYRAHQSGLPVARILDLLDHEADVVVPDNVVRSLREWGEQQNRITVHRAVALCEASSPRLLSELWADSAVRIHLDRQLTPTVAVVKDRRLPALRSSLLQQDVLPMYSQADEPTEGLIRASPDGELHPVHQGPNMLLSASLRVLAEERDGTFHLTEAAVTRALSQGIRAQEYLTRLETLHRGPLPADVVARVRSWAVYPARATLREALVLELKDPSIADELLADGRIAGMLARIPGDSDSDALLVQTHDLETLRRLLKDRGIELAQGGI